MAESISQIEFDLNFLKERLELNGTQQLLVSANDITLLRKKYKYHK
jgi:hypothetical protein